MGQTASQLGEHAGLVILPLIAVLALDADADAGRLGVLCAVGQTPVLLVVAFAVGTLSVFFDVAYQTSLVRLAGRDQLVRGNSALEDSRCSCPRRCSATA
ncbi:hypothetical protein GA0115234_100158 [Streptomyces sp. DvalAA-43]|nr:hypothetical protein GA0115234_100158 [Streptomyces sp. DvalAA-43]